MQHRAEKGGTESGGKRPVSASRMSGSSGAAASALLSALLMIASSRAAVTEGKGNGADDPIDIGTRVEMFVDRALIERTGGAAGLRLHPPEKREVVLTLDEPWESTS